MKTASPFRLCTSVTLDIRASRATVWALLTDPARQREWNSTLTRIEGEIREGGTV